LASRGQGFDHSGLRVHPQPSDPPKPAIEGLRAQGFFGQRVSEPSILLSVTTYFEEATTNDVKGAFVTTGVKNQNRKGAASAMGFNRSKGHTMIHPGTG
jgi:hypothetical protein